MIEGRAGILFLFGITKTKQKHRADICHGLGRKTALAIQPAGIQAVPQKAVQQLIVQFAQPILAQIRIQMGIDQTLISGICGLLHSVFFVLKPFLKQLGHPQLRISAFLCRICLRLLNQFHPLVFGLKVGPAIH